MQIDEYQYNLDLEEALKIQKGLLPQTSPHIEGFQVASCWKPAAEVSGDYYDVIKLNEYEYAICLADVSGKSMAAALLMSNLQAAVRALASADVSPKEMCEKLNRIMCSNIVDGRYIALIYCLLNVQTRLLRYSNAGHQAGLMLRSKGSVLKIVEGGTMVGLFRDWRYEENSLTIEAGDMLVLLTDGLIEATNEMNEEFGENGIISVWEANRKLNAEGLGGKIIECVSEFCNGSFLDDATMLIISLRDAT